jgi:hypothetical protein
VIKAKINSYNRTCKTVKSLSHRKPTRHDVARRKRKKVIVIGDSNVRGLATELSTYLGKSFEVRGTIMSGSGLCHITGLASRDISQLQHNEFVIIYSGANDINKNDRRSAYTISGNLHYKTNIPTSSHYRHLTDMTYKTPTA